MKYIVCDICGKNETVFDLKGIDLRIDGYYAKLNIDLCEGCLEWAQGEIRDFVRLQETERVDFGKKQESDRKEFINSLCERDKDKI